MSSSSSSPNNDVLCAFCFDLRLRSKDFLGGYDDDPSARRAGFHKKTLPNTSLMSENERCPFCRLILTAIIDSNPDDPDIPELLRRGMQCGIEWIKDGRTLE